MLIPKIVHVSWKSKDILENKSPIILNGLKNLVLLNPDWHLQISDDEDVQRYLNENLSHKDYSLLCERHIVEKVDVWRLLKIFNEGGMYIDIDRPFNKKLKDIILPNKKCILPTNNDYDFSQDLIISAPNNPIYKEILNLNLQRRYEGSTNIYYLGAQTYMHGLTKTLFGYVIDTNPGNEIFSFMRREIEKIDFLQTYKEIFPDDTFVYTYDSNTYEVGNKKTKKEFYQEFDIQHWMNYN